MTAAEHVENKGFVCLATATPEKLADDGDRIREQEAVRRKAKTRASQDIGEAPPISDPQRRERCLQSFGLFCTTYDPQTFNLPFGRNGLRAIDRIEETIREGGLYALAEPRGDGKTAKLRMASLWAILRGSRKYLMYVGANGTKASRLLAAVKTLLWRNRRLYADFGPELHGFWKLEGESRAASGQRYHGEKTLIQWEANLIRFAQMPGSACSGAAFQSCGIESADVRGSSVPGIGGEGTLRPDFVIIDDPQTDETARSPLETQHRYETIMSGVLGTEGSGDVPLSGIMLITCIEENDLADRVLDRKQCPEWRGERMRLMDAMPTNMELWDRYAEIKHECLRSDKPLSLADDFLRENWDAMHTGAVPTWPERTKGKLSAVQYAMDLYYRDQRSFWAEYQNEPKRSDAVETASLNPGEVRNRTNGLPAERIPIGSTHLVGHIDVQHSLLYWGLLDCDDRLTGNFHYGTWPEQPRRYFALRDAPVKLADVYRGAQPKSAVRQGLIDLMRRMLGRPRVRQDGAIQPVELILIDWSDGAMTDVVAEVCKIPEFASIAMPAAGKGIGPANSPMHAYHVRQGERLGHHWLISRNAKFAVRSATVDTNYWKSHAAAALSMPIGNVGSIALYGDRNADHRMFADHCMAETASRLTNEKTGRTVEIWQPKPGRPDNHHWDNLVGCCAAASIQGCSAGEDGNATSRRRVKLSEIQRQKRGR